MLTAKNVDFKCVLFGIAVVDAWGKLPSGILDGNLYELGAFSECFHIIRNGETYKARYCMGQLVFDLKSILGSKSHQYNVNTLFPNIPQMDHELQLAPRLVVPQ